MAYAGHRAATNSRVTAEKIAVQLRATDLTRLSAGRRTEVLRSLANKINALSGDERRSARMDRNWERLFSQMTVEEKGAFIDATMPPGFKQMLAAFQQLPETMRQRTMRDALRRRKEAAAAQGTGDQGTNSVSAISPELQKRILKSDLNSYFDESSGEMKYELLLMLEEAQRLMENGWMFRGVRRRKVKGNAIAALKRFEAEATKIPGV